MDISNLIIQLQAKVNNLTYNQLAVAKSIELLKTGQVNYANTLTELPSASASNGKMYYIRGLGIYYSNGTSWTTIETINYIIQNTSWSWGIGTCGVLGTNLTGACNQPVSVVGGFTDWCRVSTGLRFNSSGVRQNGTAWGWGYNVCGAVGDNTAVNRSSPVSVVGGYTDWCGISSGCLHTAGIRQNGTIWFWGYGNLGRLGDNCGTLTNRSSPVSVVGGFTDWCQVSAGGAFSLGLRTNGNVWSWGVNDAGQLGDTTTTNRSSPVSITLNGGCFISAGMSHSLAISTAGQMAAWGCNAYGKLGDCTVANKNGPVLVVGGFTDWCQGAAGGSHSLGVRTNGSAWAWGSGGGGYLGNNCTTSRSSPVSVVGGFTDWCQLSAGACHSLGVRQNGTAWAWGGNTACQLGDGTSSGRSSPVSVLSPYTDWCRVSAGGEQSLAIRNFVDS